MYSGKVTPPPLFGYLPPKNNCRATTSLLKATGRTPLLSGPALAVDSTGGKLYTPH